MTRLILIFFVLSPCVANAQWNARKPVDMVVSNVSLSIVPKVVSSVHLWTTNNSYEKDIYEMYSNRVYWALSSGTSGINNASAPVHTDGDATATGQSILWRRVHPVRNGIRIDNVSTCDIYLGFGLYNGEVNKGIHLEPSGSGLSVWMSGPPGHVPQHEIRGITAGGDGTVTYQEW